MNGSIPERAEADEAEWHSLPFGELVWFRGTRILGISFYNASDQPAIRDAGGLAHGAATTHLAAREAPNAIIVAVQVSGGCLDEAACVIEEEDAEAMEWIAAQPWIDVVSISRGFPGNPPTSGELRPEALQYLEASKRAAAAGKIIVNGAGNTITPPIGQHHAGPPWVIAVGGFLPRSAGESPDASKAVDIVSNMTDMIPPPWWLDEGRRRMGGTSVATPIVAGTLARALDEIRSVGASPAPGDLRAALNATGLFVSATDWDPTVFTSQGSDPFAILATRSLPVVIQPQMGWGYVNGSFAPEIARRVLENDLSIPAGKEQAAIFQAEWQRAREEYWTRDP